MLGHQLPPKKGLQKTHQNKPRLDPIIDTQPPSLAPKTCGKSRVTSSFTAAKWLVVFGLRQEFQTTNPRCLRRNMSSQFHQNMSALLEENLRMTIQPWGSGYEPTKSHLVSNICAYAQRMIWMCTKDMRIPYCVCICAVNKMYLRDIWATYNNS